MPDTKCCEFYVIAAQERCWWHAVSYQAEQKVCPSCRTSLAAAFPAEVRAPIQYGNRLGAIAVYLVEQQLLIWERACEVLPDLLGVRMSQGTLASLIARCAKQLEPIEVLIQEELKTAEVLHQDITPLLYAQF